MCPELFNEANVMINPLPFNSEPGLPSSHDSSKLTQPVPFGVDKAAKVGGPLPPEVSLPGIVAAPKMVQEEKQSAMQYQMCKLSQQQERVSCGPGLFMVILDPRSQPKCKPKLASSGGVWQRKVETNCGAGHDDASTCNAVQLGTTQCVSAPAGQG